MYQDDDDANDLSDLGLSTSKKNDDEDDNIERLHHDVEGKCWTESEQNLNDPEEDVFRGAEEPAASATIKVATVAVTTKKESVTENGYDRAIKDYVDFAESKRSSMAKCDEQQQYQNKNQIQSQNENQNQSQQQSCRKSLTEMKRRMSAPKIEEKVMLLKTRSQSTKDLNAAVANELPKVDIGKRREVFEKICLETKAEVQQATSIVTTRQSAQPIKKKPLEISSPSPPPPPSKPQPPATINRSTVITVIQQQIMCEDNSLPKSPSPPPGKLMYKLCYLI